MGLPDILTVAHAQRHVFASIQAALGAATSILDHPDGTPGMLAKRETQRPSYPHKPGSHRFFEQAIEGGRQKTDAHALWLTELGSRQPLLTNDLGSSQAMP